MNNLITISEPIIRVIVAIVILLFGLIFAKFFSKLIKKILKELEINRVLKEQTKIKVPIEEFLASLVKYIIYFIAVIMALNQLGLTTTSLYVILVVILVIIIIFIILAVKDFIPNIISGFFIHQKRSLKEGDTIKIKDIEGTIIHVNLVETKIETKSKDTIYIPNSLLTKNIITKKNDNK
ncbi:MAG: mechanosensitive ion channel family protein [Nanoarchaeota archaeon]|nr:mechanosensitive ion channel family protein [Nanoarchaeota archaeon]